MLWFFEGNSHFHQVGNFLQHLDFQVDYPVPKSRHFFLLFILFCMESVSEVVDDFVFEFDGG